MQEITSALWICTKCKKIFTGTIQDKVDTLPCGHTFGIAAVPEMVVRSMMLADQVEDLVGDEVEFSDIMDKLEAMIDG